MAATLTASHTTCVRDSQASLITPDPHGIPRCLPACWNLTQRTETLSSPFWSAPHLVLPCISKGNITQFRSHLESSLTLPAPSEFSSPLNFPSSPCRDLISTHSSASPLLSQSKASAMSYMPASTLADLQIGTNPAKTYIPLCHCYPSGHRPLISCLLLRPSTIYTSDSPWCMNELLTPSWGVNRDDRLERVGFS